MLLPVIKPQQINMQCYWLLIRYIKYNCRMLLLIMCFLRCHIGTTLQCQSHMCVFSAVTSVLLYHANRICVLSAVTSVLLYNVNRICVLSAVTSVLLYNANRICVLSAVTSVLLYNANYFTMPITQFTKQLYFIIIAQNYWGECITSIYICLSVGLF